MLGREHFYFATTRAIIVAVGAIFENIQIEREGRGLIEVPMYYSPREKFIDAGQNGYQFQDTERTQFDQVFPAIGFELIGMNMAPERKTNPLHQINSRTKDNRMMYNKVPYDLQFSVYIGTKTFEDSLKIVEQIVPFFQPEITFTIKDREDFGIEDTNITITLDSVSQDTQVYGSLHDKRTILWTLNLTAKAYYYMPALNVQRIKEAITEYGIKDYTTGFERIMTKMTAEVVPRTAERDDPHIIIDSVEEE